MSLILKSFLAAGVLALAAIQAQANGLDALQKFTREVKSGSAHFTQTVTSPDGKKKKTSIGQFEFARPGRFRFTYTKPFEQLIVGDGRKVWIYDADLNQVSARPMAQLLGASPAALLAGGDLNKDLDWVALPAQEGLEWVQAKPKKAQASAAAEESSGFQTLRVGFRGTTLAEMVLLDQFGQRSLLTFDQFKLNAPFAPTHFEFKAPPGADVVEQ
jgi:outer membrane lipoprotein carrier protein